MILDDALQAGIYGKTGNECYCKLAFFTSYLHVNEEVLFYSRTLIVVLILSNYQ